MNEKHLRNTFLAHPPVEKGGFNEFIKENLKDWITYANLKERIFNEYNISYPRRSWNKYIEVKNQAFCDGENDMYIAHSNKGYKITKDREEIEASIKHLDTMAKNMLKKESNAKKALNRSVDNG
ncbi:hypothetical protein [Holdemanella biformis]